MDPQIVDAAAVDWTQSYNNAVLYHPSAQCIGGGNVFATSTSAAVHPYIMAASTQYTSECTCADMISAATMRPLCFSAQSETSSLIDLATGHSAPLNQRGVQLAPSQQHHKTMHKITDTAATRQQQTNSLLIDLRSYWFSLGCAHVPFKPTHSHRLRF